MIKSILLFAAIVVASFAHGWTVVNVSTSGITFRVEGTGGTYTKPLPARIEIPSDASTAWDGDSLTLTVTTPSAEEAGDPDVETYVLTTQEIDDAIAHEAPAPVPARVTKVQLRIALINAEIDLDELIDGLPAQDAAIARILVDNADYFSRAAGMVETLGSAAGLTSAQLDELFRAAAKINPETL